jgi:hypothetical protein
VAALELRLRRSRLVDSVVVVVHLRKPGPRVLADVAKRLAAFYFTLIEPPSQ